MVIALLPTDRFWWRLLGGNQNGLTDSWNDITQSPFKVLRQFPGLQDILLSVWGKSLRNGKQQATPTPSTATSVQVHCLIKEDALAPFMNLSGFNQLRLTPKTAEGKPHPSWKMLWLDSATDLQSATVTAAKIHD